MRNYTTGLPSARYIVLFFQDIVNSFATTAKVRLVKNGAPYFWGKGEFWYK